MILNLEIVGVNRLFKNALILACDDSQYYIRRSEWPKEAYIQIKFDKEDGQYIKHIYIIDANCDIHDPGTGWQTNIDINDATASDWEIWHAIIG